MVKDDLDLDRTDEEFTSEIKALMINNPKKFFMKSFSKFKGNKFNRGIIWNQNSESEKAKEE